MKISILISFFLILNLYSNTRDDMYNFYQNKRYKKVCNLGFKYFDKYKKDESFISLYAFGCLNSDYIDRLSNPISILKLSKESRSNAAYFSVILMQKKMLYHALIDGYEISNLHLPTTNHILSKVFDFYSKLGKHNKRRVYLFEDENDKKLTYKLYLVKDGRMYKMIVEEFYDTIKIQRHIYW